jgi:thioredoxin reductase
VIRIVDDDPSGFRVSLVDGGTIAARRVLVATGLRDEMPDIPGLRERWARDVLHCPYCHGYEVKDQTLGVLGWQPEATRYAHIIRQWSRDVVYLAPAGTLSAGERAELSARTVAVVEGEVQRVVVDDDRLCGVDLDDGDRVYLDALFVPPRFVPNHNLLVGLGCELDPGGWAITDDTGLTSVAGVWAAGNVTNPRAQVITAAGEGSTAAIAINADLVQDDVRNALLRQGQS